MNLFKRLLLSLFPKIFWGLHGPANVFLWLVNAKHFFTVMSKRMVENPKLNMFDIDLDAVETKIWFGNEASVKPKDVELYFSYCCAANLNWYRFYSPANVWATLSIALSQFFVDDFPRNKKWSDQFMALLITINTAIFVFAAKIRSFPTDMSIEDQFNWFVSLFFWLFKVTLVTYGIKLTKKQLLELESILIKQSEILFAIFQFCKLFVSLFWDMSPDKNFTTRLYEKSVDEWAYLKRQNDISFNEQDQLYIKEVMPVEIITKLLFNWDDVFWIAEHVVPSLYERASISQYMSLLIWSKSIDLSVLHSFVSYLLDHTIRKKNFFPAVKRMLMLRFQKNNPDLDTLDELISSISDWSGVFTIPDSLKKESAIMDRMLNFFVWLMGVLNIGRSDSYYVRLFHGPMLSRLSSFFALNRDKTHWFVLSLSSLQSKSAFFYHTIFEWVRSGKSSFIVPYIAADVALRSDDFLVDQYNTNAIAILSQDILVKDIKLSIHNKQIVDNFQLLQWTYISKLLWLNNLTFIEQFYSPLDRIFTQAIFNNSMSIYVTDQEIKNMKEAIYTLEYRLFHDLLLDLHTANVFEDIKEDALLNSVAFMRDTLTWFMLLLTVIFTKQQVRNVNYSLDLLITIYLQSVLLLPLDKLFKFQDSIWALYNKYQILLSKITTIDDNHYFLEVWVDCRRIYISKEFKSDISIEDSLWLRGYLKHATFYNKRYILPKI